MRLCAGVFLVASLISPASAQETVDYTYDTLGRLVSATTSGSSADGKQVNTSFDPVGNRTTQAVSGLGSSGTPTLSVGAASATEGGNLQFTVTRSGNPSLAVGVSFATSSGTATSGSDFTANSGSLTFAASQTVKTVTVLVNDDSTSENSETMTLTLSSPTGGAVLGTASATGTIHDNDSANNASFSISNAQAVEGGSLAFTVTKAGTTTQTHAVNWASANGTATAGADYTSGSGTLSFSPAETSKVVTIASIDDSAIESSETVLVNLSGATNGATITDSQGVGTIDENDILPPPSFAIANAAAVTEGGTLQFTVTKTGSTASSYSVNYATANGTATAGSDYTSTSGTLTFAANETSKNVAVATIYDSASETAETVLVNLSGATGGSTITTAQGSGTINDDDPIVLTDAFLNVLSAHQSVYTCDVYDIPELGYYQEICTLNSTGKIVWNTNFGPPEAPGYYRPPPGDTPLQVQPSYYGLGGF